MNNRILKVGQLSEEKILERIVPLLPFGNHTILGPGDDCAVVRCEGNKFLVTTDVLVEGVHFRSDWSNGHHVGARAAAQNLADVVAMGATPAALVVSLVLPKDLPVAWVEDFAGGVHSVLAPTGAGVVGGDLVAGPAIVVSVTAHGVTEGEYVTRSGAQAGDVLAVAGRLGSSAAGLAALTSGVVSPDLPDSLVPAPFTQVVSDYRVPKPPLEAGRVAVETGAKAMMDLSDGLAPDAARLASASGVGFNISRSALEPDVAHLQQVGEALETDPLDWVLYGGEDHGLLATFPPYTLVSHPFRQIGTVTAPKPGSGGGPGQVLYDGEKLAGGFDHFSA